MKKNYKIKYTLFANFKLLQNFSEYNIYNVNKIFEF